MTAYILVIISFPMLFLYTFQGFIDIAGVIFTLSSVLILIADKNENDIARFFLIGILLGIAVLLRRWNAFFALSFFITLLIDCIIFRKSLKPILSTLVSFAFVLLFLFQPLVSNILLKNYSQLYSDYKMGLSFDFHMLFKYFGVITFSVVLISGFFLCIKRGIRQSGVFLVLQPVICFIIFIRVQSHGQQHLFLYLPSFVCLLSLCICHFIDKINKRNAACTLLAASAFLPTLSTFIPELHPRQIEKILSVPVLPDFTFRPPVWSDADTAVKLIRYLDEAVGSKGKTAGILASSFQLNYDILINAEASLNLERVSNVNRSYLIPLPAVDSRDAFPGELFKCDYLLVADPIQLHLGKGKQKVVYLPASMLLNGTGIGAAFQITGEQFTFNNRKMKITLYKKIRDLTDFEKQQLIDEFSTNKLKGSVVS